MSSEQSLDPQLIEQTKQQIRMLVNEIAQLAKSDIAPEEFYGEFLPRVVSALAASGGAVWVSEERGRLALGYQINLQQTQLGASEENQMLHGRLLQKVLTAGEGAIIPPHSGSADDEQGGNPTEFLLVLAPLRAGEETVGVVEVFQRPDTRPATQKGYLRFLTEMCDRAGEFFKTHQLRHFSDRQVLWTQLEDFTRGVHTSLDPRDTAYTIANDGRRLIGCDRVSVAIRKGRRCQIEAVSGQDMFDKRSNTVRLLGKLASAVVASGEAIWYTGDTSNMAPQVEDAVQEYVDESHSKTVAVLPLERPLPVGAEDDPEDRPEPEPPIGALIVEQIEDSRIPEKMLQRVEVVCQHSSMALANSLEHNSLFLMPVWRAIGKSRFLVKARTLPKTILVVSAVLIVIVAMVVVPWGFKMQADGSIEPALRREVFAGIEGEVEEVFVTDGAKVLGDDAIVDQETSTDGREVLATITDDPLTVGLAHTLLGVPAGNGSFMTNGVCVGDMARVRFTTDASGNVAYAEFTVEEVVDENTLRLKTGLSTESRVPEKIEIWRATLLARMGNTDLKVRIADNVGQLNQTRERLDSINSRLSDTKRGQLSSRDRAELSGTRRELEDRKVSLLAQQDLYRAQERELEIRSPITGQVISWEIEHRLMRRPVQRGDALMEVADTEGAWQLEILMPDKRMGVIERARQKAKEQDPPSDLVVEFILASDPDTTHVGRVKDIAPSAEVHGDEGNTVMIKVEITDEVKAQLPQPLKLGESVSAKILCGKRPIGYVLFHDLIAFVQSKIVFRWF
ncbi:MAG: HlyD family secretion protein [Planctomycetes bacterium]|nr:HlyD family secretion protein [Planctomycetota bacterium]